MPWKEAEAIGDIIRELEGIMLRFYSCNGTIQRFQNYEQEEKGDIPYHVHILPRYSPTDKEKKDYDLINKKYCERLGIKPISEER